MSYNAQEIFERLGVLVKWHYQLGADAAGLDAIHATAIARFDASQDDRECLVQIGNEIAGQKAQAESTRQGVTRLVEQYVTDHLKADINSPYDSVGQVLADLAEAMNEASPPDTVDGNAVAATTPQQDPDNQRGDGTASAVTVTEMARDDNYFEVVCTDDTEIDRERWSVQASVTGAAPAELTTGEEFAWNEAGIEGLTIDPLPILETGDTAGQLDNWALEGLVRGGNTDEDGKLYVEVEQTPDGIVQSGDQHQQAANWSICGASLKNTDSGRFYVALVREPATFLMTGDEDVDLTDWSLSGVARATNTDPDGRLYVNVACSGGTYTVSLFSDPQRNDKVAEGSTAAGLPATVTLVEQNGSGIGGSVDLESYTQDDTDIVLDVPYHYVRLYKDPGRMFGLVAQGISFAADAAGVLVEEQDESGLSGQLDLDFGVDDAGIELELPLRYVRLYRQDPAGMADDEKAAQLVAQGATESSACASSSSSSSGAETVELVALHGSGLTGQVDFNYLADATGIDLQAGWSKGDKWTFNTTSDEAGTFQCFFRDRLGVTLPAVIDGSETIADSLAE